MLDSMRFDEFQSLESHDMSWLHDAGVATQGRLQELAVVERCGETPDFAEGRQIRQMGQTLHVCSTVKCFNPTLSERVPECQMMSDVSRCCRGNGIMRRLSLIDIDHWQMYTSTMYLHYLRNVSLYESVLSAITPSPYFCPCVFFSRGGDGDFGKPKASKASNAEPWRQKWWWHRRPSGPPPISKRRCEARKCSSSSGWNGTSMTQACLTSRRTT